MEWPLRLRHKLKDAPTVKAAVQKRDELFDDLDIAIREVDRVQDRVLADYMSAEQQRLIRRQR